MTQEENKGQEQGLTNAQKIALGVGGLTLGALALLHPRVRKAAGDAVTDAANLAVDATQQAIRQAGDTIAGISQEQVRQFGETVATPFMDEVIATLTAEEPVRTFAERVLGALLRRDATGSSKTQESQKARRVPIIIDADLQP